MVRNNLQKLTFCFLFVFTIIQFATSEGNIHGCFDCICREKVHCGITWGFWSDAGKPSGDFNTCYNDYACARLAMENYYRKFAKDCNGDGVINCYDYARMHILGKIGCVQPSDNQELYNIDNCLHTH